MLNKKGFTLIELLVVMAVIGILASVLIVNFGHNTDQQMRLEKDRFTTFLRDVQNRSLSAQKIVPPGGCSITGKICGFGVHFDESDAKAYFIQSGGAGALDADCATVSKVYPDSSCQDLDSFTLRNGATFGASDVFFLIPNGEVSHADGTSVDPSDPIQIISSDDSVTIDTELYPSGLIK